MDRLMETSNVFLFVPNLIGYGRIVFAILACYYMPTNYVLTGFYYALSVGLDAVDGYAARALNQSSRLGAMLDQLTDRMSTMSLMMCLCYFYPQYMFFWQLNAIIDVSSHWLHLHSHDISGSSSHKNVDETTNPILRLYYTSRTFLFFMCFANEAFFSFAYITYFTVGPRIPIIGVGIYKLLMFAFMPISLTKTAISLLHLVQAAQKIVDVETKAKSVKKS